MTIPGLQRVILLRSMPHRARETAAWICRVKPGDDEAE
jgi:hypothetical protein